MAQIAILIPAYNSAATVGETLSSIQSQQSGIDVLAGIYLADDCSTDMTVSAARDSWQLQVPPLHILTCPTNLGERGNINQALTSIPASIEWILFLHADDLVKPHWLATMLARIAVCPDAVGSICSSWDTLWPDRSIAPGEDNLSRPVEYITGSVAAVRDTLMRGCWWHFSGCAIRRRALTDVGGFHPQLPQLGDWQWLLRCLQRGWAIEYIPRTLMIYRQSEASVSSLSFQLDRDIRERLLILRTYNVCLDRQQIFNVHARLMQFSVSRMARAGLRRSAKRTLLAGQTLLLVLGSLAGNLASRRSDAAPPPHSLLVL